jgi:hypothetical protein
VVEIFGPGKEDSERGDALRVGIAVYCAHCGRRKKPRGRSAPFGVQYCDYDCYGYNREPQVGSLWPGETEQDFGYPIGSEGTREETRHE